MSISKVVPVSTTRLRVEFSSPVVNNIALTSVDSYTFGAAYGAAALYLVAIELPDSDDDFAHVFLDVSEMTNDLGYTLAANGLVHSDGAPVDSTPVSFEGFGARPTIKLVLATDKNTVEVYFNEPMKDTAAIRNPSRYTFDNGLVVNSVDSVVGDCVKLKTSDQLEGQIYTLTIHADFEALLQDSFEASDELNIEKHALVVVNNDQVTINGVDVSIGYEGFSAADATLWLRADLGITFNGGNVASWENQGTAGGVWSIADPLKQPEHMAAGGPNGQACIAFGSAGDPEYLDSNIHFNALTAAEAFIILKLDADPPASGSGGIHTLYPLTDTAHYPFSDGIVYDMLGSTTRKPTGNPAQSLANWHWYNVVSVANEWSSAINGAEHYSTNVNAVGFGGATTRIGAHSDLTYMIGRIAEVIMFDRKLEEVERQQIETYIYQRYGLRRFEPTQLGANLGLWLRADLGINLNGGTVASWIDQSGNGNDASQATSANQLTYVNPDTDGLPTVSSDGVNDCMVIDDSEQMPSGANWSLAFWVKKDSASGTKELWSTWHGGAGNLGILIRSVTGNLEVFLSSNGTATGSASRSSFFTAGVWTHICITFNAGVLTLYKDGVALSWTTTSGIPASVFNTSSQVVLLREAPSSGGSWDGDIDDLIVVTNRTLTAAEVAELYAYRKRN